MAKKSPASAVAEAVEKASVLATKMSEATDELNAWLARTESALAELKLGVTARVCMTPADSQSPFSRYLAFGKDKQEWKLLLEVGMDGDDDWEVSRLLNASRGARLEAVDFLAPLVERLVETAIQEVREVREKTEVVKEIAIKLGAMPF